MEEDNKEVMVDGTSVDETNPTAEVEENEDEVVGTLDDTSEGNASNTDEEEKPSVEQEKKYTQEDVDKAIKSRLARLESENARKLQEYEDLANVLRAGMGKDNTRKVNELSNDLRGFYKEQGIDIPEVKKSYNERDEKILARADAEEIIEAGEDEVNRIANQIYNKPESQRTVREKVIFETLGKHVVMQKAKNELKAKGVDETILNDDKFKKFASRFNTSTPISEVYDLYDRVEKATAKKTPPPSTGSVKTTGKSTEIKDYYTPEEVSKFTMEQLKNNPKLMKAVDNSMLKWNK